MPPYALGSVSDARVLMPQAGYFPGADKPALIGPHRPYFVRIGQLRRLQERLQRDIHQELAARARRRAHDELMHHVACALDQRPASGDVLFRWLEWKAAHESMFNYRENGCRRQSDWHAMQFMDDWMNYRVTDEQRQRMRALVYRRPNAAHDELIGQVRNVLNNDGAWTPDAAATWWVWNDGRPVADNDLWAEQFMNEFASNRLRPETYFKAQAHLRRMELDPVKRKCADLESLKRVLHGFGEYDASPRLKRAIRRCVAPTLDRALTLCRSMDDIARVALQAVALDDPSADPLPAATLRAFALSGSIRQPMAVQYPWTAPLKCAPLSAFSWHRICREILARFPAEDWPTALVEIGRETTGRDGFSRRELTQMTDSVFVRIQQAKAIMQERFEGRPYLQLIPEIASDSSALLDATGGHLPLVTCAQPLGMARSLSRALKSRDPRRVRNARRTTLYFTR